MPRSSLPAPLHPAHFLPDGWDALWQSKKGNAPNEQARLMVIGDSIASGQYASDCVKKSWVGLLRDALTQSGRLPLAADYFACFGHGAASANMNNAPWTAMQNGHAAINSLNFSWHYLYYTSDLATVDAHQTFTSPFACTAMDLFYVDYWAGTFQYQVDGGSWQTVTMTGDNNGAHTTTKKVSITGLANTTHTLAIGKQSLQYGLLPMGVACYPAGGGNGLYLARFSYPGAQACDFDPGYTANQYPAERFGLYAGISPQNYVGTGRTFGYPTQPHLAIIALGVNDCAASRTAATYGGVLRRLVQGLRAGSPNCSILFLVNCNPDPDISDGTGSANAVSWWLYQQQIYPLAQAFGCAIVNIHAKWNENPLGAGFLAGNGVHPTDAGHLDIANTLLTVI